MVARRRSILHRNEYDLKSSNDNDNSAEDVPQYTEEQHRGHAAPKEKSIAEMYTDKFGTDDEDEYNVEDVERSNPEAVVFSKEEQAVPEDFQEVFEFGRQETYFEEGRPSFNTPGAALRVSPASSSSYAIEPGLRMDAEQIAHVCVGALLGILMGTVLYRCVFGRGRRKEKDHHRSQNPWINTEVSFQDEIKFQDEIPDEYGAYGTKHLNQSHLLAPIDHGYNKKNSQNKNYDNKYSESPYDSYYQDPLGGVGFESAQTNVEGFVMTEEEESIDAILKNDSSSGRTRSINNILNNDSGNFRSSWSSSTGRTRSIDIPDEI